MMKSLILLGFLAFFCLNPFHIAVAARIDSNEQLVMNRGKNVQANYLTAQSKKPTRTERRQQRLAKKLEKWKTKLLRGDRISLAWLGVVVMLVGGLFIVLGLVIPYVGLLFLILGIIIAFAGLLLTLLLGGLSVEKD